MATETVTDERRHPLRVAVIAKRADVVSETFVAAHLEHLPFEVAAYYQTDWRGDAGAPGRLWPRWAKYAHRLLGMRFERRTFHDVVLARELRRARIDVVLAEFGTVGAQTYRAADLVGIPFVVHFRGSDATDRSIVGSVVHDYPKMLATARHVVCVSESLAQVVRQWMTDGSNISIIPSGVDPVEFDGATPALVGPSFLAVGRFVEKKAPHLTVRAFGRVVHEVPDADLVLVGDGPLRQRVIAEIARLGLEDRVQLVGFVGPGVVAELMRRSRCFVQHSVTAESGDTEGVPKAVSEAQMIGLPVVATRHAGIPEIVEDGVTGILVDEHDVEGMAAAMTRVALDPDLARRMGEVARDRAMTLVSLDRNIARIARLLSDAGSSNHSDEYPNASNSRSYNNWIRLFVRAVRYSR